MTDARRVDPAGDVSIVVREAFDVFYRREFRSVVGLAFVLSGSRSGAEDLAQDAFIAAFRHWGRINAYDNPAAWVRRVVANRSISVARRRIAETRALLRIGGQRCVVPALTTEVDGLWSAVRHLPRRQAQVVALRYWDRLSIKEVAEVLEISEATVKSHLAAARKALTATLATPADLNDEDEDRCHARS